MHDVFVYVTDARMRALHDELSRRGLNVQGADALPTNGRYDIILLPYAKFPKIESKRLFSLLSPEGKVYAGGYPQEFAEECEERGIRFVDWLSDEELTVKNAHLTAEGALGIAITQSPLAVKNSFVTVIGYGRVARACVKLFSAAGAHIRIMARSYPARLDAYTRGCKAYCIADNAPLGDCDVLINTVPTVILDSSRLEYLPKSALIIELASPPYGIDMDAARALGLTPIIASGLPARVAPKTAGRLMADLVTKEVG